MQKLNWDDIVIVGDSFARHRFGLDHWPMVLSLKLVGEQHTHKVPRGKGFGGASWWSTRKCLLSELDKHPIKLLVICHTEHSRIPNENNLGINAGGILYNNSYFNGDITVTGDSIANACLAYYKKLYNPHFSLWAQERWYEELDRLIEKHQISYVIHMHCFKNDKTELYKFQNGITGTEVLSNYALKTSIHMPNHFLPETNIKIANALYDNFLNYSNVPVMKSLKLFD